MKINQPITQVECPFPRGKYVVSKTDLKGAITFVNDTFVELSGFTREELLGRNHNIVRHPDMPPAAFADLWATVKAGHPWRGIVKNRCKNGDFYWVDAFVVPVRENDQTVGYMSVRSEPTRAAIEEAEILYRRLMQGKGAISSQPPLLKRISIRARLLAVMGFLGLMLLVGAAIGVGGNALTHDTLESTFTTRLEPVDIVGRIAVLMGDNRTHALLALQHNPANPFARLHEHSLTLHTDAINSNREEITALIGKLGQRELGATLKPLLERYSAAREVYVKEGIQPVRQAILEGQFDQANDMLLKTLNPAYIKATTAARELQDALKESASKERQLSQERYRLISTLAIGGTVVALLLVALAAWNLLRAIVRPLDRVVHHFDRISQGNLTDQIDISGRDEAGRVLTILAAMQVHLKIMIDEIQVAARSINAQATQVEAQTNAVVNQSVQQRDGAASVAAATEEFSQSVREVADSASQTAVAAESAQSQVMEAQASMEKSTVATGRVADAVQASSRTIADLNQAIAKIGGITQIIKEIAEQTNLLALNAAIEAARAGDMGRGFAVVADEVRKLAERTTASTADITATVTEIRHVTDASVASMGHAVTEVEEGIGMINASMSGLSRITGTSQEVNDMARHIAAAAGEQAIASEQVANSMEQIAGLIDENLAAAQGAKQSVDALKTTAQDLEGVVGRFKVIA